MKRRNFIKGTVGLVAVLLGVKEGVTKTPADVLPYDDWLEWTATFWPSSLGPRYGRIDFSAFFDSVLSAGVKIGEKLTLEVPFMDEPLVGRVVNVVSLTTDDVCNITVYLGEDEDEEVYSMHDDQSSYGSLEEVCGVRRLDVDYRSR